MLPKSDPFGNNAFGREAVGQFVQIGEWHEAFQSRALPEPDVNLVLASEF